MQPEQESKEVDHLPFPAIEVPFWNLKRNRRRSIDTVVSDDVSYVDAAQAFNVSFRFKRIIYIWQKRRDNIIKKKHTKKRNNDYFYHNFILVLGFWDDRNERFNYRN